MALFNIFKSKSTPKPTSEPTSEPTVATSEELAQDEKELVKDDKEILNQGLEKTRTGLWGKISRALVGKSKVDESLLDELEEILITSDVGVETTLKIIERIESRVAKDKYTSTEEFYGLLREEMTSLVFRSRKTLTATRS